MKPQFALDLSNTSIRLLHLHGRDEVELGAVNLDDPAFDQRVYDLYRIAEEHAKGRVRTLLLIPNSEVLYTRVETGPGDREARAKAIGEALEGMTPYKLDELVFDWRVDGDEAVVAAVAALTLEEAESFATARGFNPLGFSSRPVNGAFKGIPDFGTSKLAQARKTGAPWPAPPQPPAQQAPEVEAMPEAGAATEDAAQQAPLPGAEATTVEAPAPEATEAPASDAPRPPAADAEIPAAQSAEKAVTEGSGSPVREEPAEASGQTDLFAEPEPPTAPGLPTEHEPDATSAMDAPLRDTQIAPPADETGKPAPEDVTPPTARSALAEDGAPVAATGTEPAASTKPAPQPEPARDPADIALDDVPPPRAFRRDGATPDPDSAPAKADADAVGALSPGAASGTAPDGDEPVDKSEGVRKRGAGRTTKAKAGRKAKPGASGTAEPAPAFSTRRQPAQKSAAEPINDMPPPRPAALPPIGSALPGASAPRRPKIPPHLAKPVSGPNARSTPAKPPLAKATEGPKPAKGSRLSQLMARLQNTPDGGAGDDVSPAPIPDLPKPPERQLPRAGKAKAAPPPVHELPMPKSPPLPPKQPRPSGALPDPVAASASLTPGARASGKPQGGTPLPPPRTLSRGGLNEAEAMTLFGARGETRERPLKPVLIGIAVVLVLAVAVWAGVLLLGRGPDQPTATDSGALGLGAPVTGELDADASPPTDTAAPENVEVAALPPAEENDTPPALPQSDVAVLTGPDDVADAPAVGAGDNGHVAAMPPSVAPAPEIDSSIGPQETAQPLPEPETRQEAESRYAALGIWQIPPDPPTLPEAGRIDDLRLAALAGTTEFADAPNLAGMPEPAGLTPPAAPTPPAPLAFEEPPAPTVTEPAESEVAALPAAPQTPAESAPPAAGQARAGDGVSTEDIRVTQGAPAVTPPERPARPNSLRDIVPVNPANGPDLRPQRRPDTLTAQQETALQPSGTAAEAETVTAPGSTVALAAAGPSAPAQPAEALPEAPTQADVAGLQPEAGLPAPDAPTTRPAVRPRARPGTEATAALTATDDGTDPLRPLARPGTVTRAETDLGTTGALGTGDAATATDAARASTAGLPRAPSPPARPASFASLVTTPEIAEIVTDAPAPPADEPAAGVTSVDGVAEANAPLPESPYAVIASRKPRNRPASLEREIEKARAKAGPPVQASAAVKPTAPTTATVAKTATEANVLNLARLNLIGVYGGNSDRRALIRLPSGRFVKVEVGDRLDGGRVASISEHELSYVKGGRNITLKMPRS